MRATARLSSKLERSVITYATAASAAGLSALALTQAAEAKIVYTKTHVLIDKRQDYQLDLNQAGVADFKIQNTKGWSDTFHAGFNVIGSNASNKIVGVKRYFVGYASALYRGAHIGPKRPFSGTMMAGLSGNSTFGNWANVRNRYLGLKFVIKHKVHYGWARLSVKMHPRYITGTLTGYAYETIPDRAIIAGNRGSTTGQGPDAQPLSLGHLSLGAAARKQPVAIRH